MGRREEEYARVLRSTPLLVVGRLGPSLTSGEREKVKGRRQVSVRAARGPPGVTERRAAHCKQTPCEGRRVPRRRRCDAVSHLRAMLTLEPPAAARREGAVSQRSTEGVEGGPFTMGWGRREV